MSDYSEVVRTAQNYYNSSDADTFYANVWGGEDIHIGIYTDADEPIRVASHRTVTRMAKTLNVLNAGAKIIDLGGGYGGSARYLAETYGCHVVSLNLSEVQNRRARELNETAGLAERITVTDGNFENIPYGEGAFDAVWSQDSFLHSGDRAAVFAEIRRVLRSGGELVFTDPMQTDDCDTSSLQPVLDRIQLDSLGSPGFYDRELKNLGFEKLGFEDLSDQLPHHYKRVKDELEAHYDELVHRISREYADNMVRGLQHWVVAGKSGNLCWGINHYRRSM